MSRLKGNEIVISGISGLFPEADDTQQLSENLFNKTDMVTKGKKFSHIKHPEFPQYMGVVDGMDKFDAHFFRVTSKQATSMDPMTRKLIEHSFSALFDAGVNPESIRGTKLGVYIASMQIDSVNYCYDKYQSSPFMISGCSKCMIANRISYWIDGKGPSIAIDHGNAGSTSALDMAVKAINSGEIDCAIIGGSNYCIKPELVLNMKRAGILCLDGKTKCFDKKGDGCVRSEAISAYFLQKAANAKRVYAEVYHVKGKYFASPDGVFSLKRNPKDIEQFLEEFYSEIDVSPKDVEYVEANGHGIAEPDANELEAIGNIFAKEKNINIGSVKSNLGNTESCSGACSVIKMCLAYQKGQIPANLHYLEPQNQIPAVKDKKIKILTESQNFGRNFTAINNFCYTGSNYHALLKGHYIPKEKKRYESSIPRLVLVSGRHEEGVNKMLNILEANPIDPEQLALLNNFFKYYVPGYTGRGYTILDSSTGDKTVCLSRGFEYYSGQTRPVWYLYSGMGSQWAGMGEDLLRIPVFADAIDRCDKVLFPKGLNIKEIVLDKDPKHLNILNSLVAITAIQIGLTDVLKSLGINPDNVIGHSVGEIGSAYADGSLTTEEAIMAAYIRSIVSYETKFIKGTMAAIGLGHKQVAELCPTEIELACHNSSESTTISGPSDIVSKFVKSLTDKGIFAKEVSSYNIAFHSRYIAEAGPKMLALLKKEIPNPKPRSNKWLSTCYLPEDWNKPESQYASAEYFTHNLMNSVLFEEAAKFIPNDAIIIEIAPHGLLQAIMKRSHSECLNLPLTRRGEADGVTFLLKSIGILYHFGLNPDLEALYPKVDFPVSTETPLLSHLVKWEHKESWKLHGHDEEPENSIFKEFLFSIFDDEYIFLQGYIRNGVHVLPEAAIIVFVWETLAAFENKEYEDTIVVFDNIKFYHQISIQLEEVLKLQVSIQKGSTHFEVIYKDSLVADGLVNLIGSTKLVEKIHFSKNEELLSQTDVYTLLRMRGYEYGKEFQSILSSNIKKNKASIKWNKRWITFLDSLIHMKILSDDYDGMTRVKFLTKLTIDTQQHKYNTQIANGIQYYNALVDNETGVTKCDGVTFEDIIFVNIPKAEINLDVEKDIIIRKKGFFKNVDINKRQHIKLTATEQNNIESLIWIDTPFKASYAKIQVSFSGLSTKDCIKLSTMENQSFGMDYSGIAANGDRVMGLVVQGAMASTIEADYDLIWPVPQHWSLAEAATVPLPYVHAFYCLAIRQKLYKHYIILVIGAAGALGQAIISIAIHLECTVFGTVGNADKKKYLLKRFPELNEHNIGYTYDNTFRAMLVERTKNKRCNIVINTASGKIRESAMNCVGGDLLSNFFLDVNEVDKLEHELFYMACLDKEKSYKFVNMSTIFDEKYSNYKKDIQIMLSEGIAKGYVRPLTSVTYSPSEISRAFKLLINRGNIGRVLVNMKNIHSSKQELSVIPRMEISSDKAYMVVCDGTELGVELLHLLFLRGAKRLIIHCDPKTINGYFHVKYALWKKHGAIVDIFSEEIQKEDTCQKFLSKAITYGPIGGILIAYSNFGNESIKVYQNKQDTSHTVSNLDNMTRSLKNLRYFAVIAATQSKFSNQKALENIEKCCIQRSDIGLPSLFVHFVQEDKNWNLKSLSTLFKTLETSLASNFVSVSSSVKTDIETKLATTNVNTNFNAGLTAFFQNISKDEVDATEPIVHMNIKSSTGFKNELNMDPDDNCIIMLPGFEGTYECLVNIAERLKNTAIALQIDPKFHESIPEIAKKMVKYVKVRFEIKSPFYLVGFSFGANIALEMAALLENEGLVGTVFCIDSSPDALRIHLDAYLGHLTEEQLQDSLIDHIYTLCTGHSSSELNQKLKSVSNWFDKVETFTKEVKTEITLSNEYLTSILVAAYDKINLAKVYKPKFILESEIVLLKGIPHPNARNLSKDYNLSLYTNKPVQIFDLKTDHAMALKDCRISNFINRNFIF